MMSAILIVLGLVAIIFAFSFALYSLMPWLLKMEAAYWGRGIEADGATKWDVEMEVYGTPDEITETTEPDFV